MEYIQFILNACGFFYSNESGNGNSTIRADEAADVFVTQVSLIRQINPDNSD